MTILVMSILIMTMLITLNMGGTTYHDFTYNCF
jgi:hypothetical protein